MPVWIIGLVGRYPANSLIQRRLILMRNAQHVVHSFGQRDVPVPDVYPVLCPVSRVWPVMRADCLRVTEPYATDTRSSASKTCMSKSNSDSSTLQQDQLEFRDDYRLAHLSPRAFRITYWKLVGIG
jgi:hypothetical protein